MRGKRLRTDTTMSMSLSYGKTRDAENARQAAAWKADKHYFIGGKRFARGMPIIAFAKVKGTNIMNNHRFTFVKATDKTVTLKRKGEEHELLHSTFLRSFRHGFCDSVFRHQGYTVDQPYNILDVDKMSKQEFYTAITRFESLDSFGLDCTDWDREFELDCPPTKSCRCKVTETELNVAYIYSITDDNGYQYIGYTTRDIYERYAEHQEEATSPKMHDWLVSTSTSLKLLQTIHYIELKEVTDIEADYIKAIPVGKCMNTKHASQEPEVFESCTYHTVSPQPPLSQWPKISDQPKYKRYRIQWREDGKVRSKTFSYKSLLKTDQFQAAEEWRSDHFS
jgi:hypothetical protein